MELRLKFIIAVIMTSGLITGAIIGTVYLVQRQGILPQNIQRQLDFKPFVVSSNSTVLHVNKSSYKYDASQQVLSFTVSSGDYGLLTVSEQTTPQTFIDISDYYTKLLDTLNRYSVFDDSLGAVYLIQPKDQKTGQTAVLNASGVLMFVRSNKDLSDDQWRQVFNQFVLES